MKQPKISDLKINKKETAKLRAKAKSKQSVKITINIDGDVLDKLRSAAEQTGVPYQRLLNRLLSENLEKKDLATSRLDRLEAEVEKLKQKLAA